MLTLLASMMIVALAPALVNAQAANSEHVIIVRANGGTTNPAPGDYSYGANSLVVITATPANSNYKFLYWLINGTGTTGDNIPPVEVPTLAPDQTLPPDVPDPSLVVGRPGYEFVGLDNYISTLNPIVIACQAGYTFQYTPVFGFTAALPTPVPTATPAATATPVVTATPVITAPPAETLPPGSVSGDTANLLYAGIAVLAIIAIIAVIAALMFARRPKK